MSLSGPVQGRRCILETLSPSILEITVAGVIALKVSVMFSVHENKFLSPADVWREASAEHRGARGIDLLIFSILSRYKNLRTRKTGRKIPKYLQSVA